MRKYGNIREYSVFEISGILEQLGERYDIVRLVDIDECRILEVTEDGMIRHGNSCFSIWGRENRCANCTSFRACRTHTEMDKMEHLGHDREQIHSIPISLELANGEVERCVIECVNYAGTEAPEYQEQKPEEYINAFDVLTRLYTQEKLFREIRGRLMEDPDGTYLLLMCNIRNFAVINRLFGIEGGNRLLTGIADMLREHCTEEEIYGRYRSDRFLLLIKKEKYDEEFFLEKLAQAGALVGSPIFSVQIKLGVYEISSSSISVTTMVERADDAVNSIRNSQTEMIAWFDPGMIEQKKKDRRIIAEFPQALREGEFEIYLQPQVKADGKVLGAEALVRWIRSDSGVHLPGEFIPVLQKSELLSTLDVYVWDKAAQLLCRWKETELENLYISVNVDPTDFFYVDVPQVFSDLCRKYTIDPKLLRAEVTETALLEDAQHAIVDHMHEKGFLVEIDDFGKGFSSLSLLKNIHADVLKIDMEFVHGKRNAERSEVIMDSVIEMAENLHMDVIAEGVENREQLEKLQELGCRKFQGFYFSRPVPVEDFEFVARGNL